MAHIKRFMFLIETIFFGLLFSAILTQIGCVYRPETEFRDLEDSFVVSPIPPDAVVCNPTDRERLNTDIYNCGSCLNSCNLVVSDRCIDGVCSCGTLGHECNPLTQECRFGICRDSDPSGRTCEFDGNCPGGNGGGFGCIVGHCSRISCVPEVCDSIDNDCDGFIDGTASGPLARYCYDRELPAQPDSMLLPPCVMGVQVCSAGEWQTCEGSRGPREEVGLFGCDSIDNNCDGCVDGNLDRTSGVCIPSRSVLFDVVFVVDTSGSMIDDIGTIIAVMRSFSDRFAGNSNFHFSIVLSPGPDSPGILGSAPPASSVLISLVPYERFVTVLTLDMFMFDTIGQEPNWDVIYELGIGELDVGWRPGSARIIVLFSDEQGQSYRPGFPITEELMCASLVNGESFFYFTEPGYRSSWDLCGTYFQLSTVYEQVLADLNSVIVDPCTSR